MYLAPKNDRTFCQDSQNPTDATVGFFIVIIVLIVTDLSVKPLANVMRNYICCNRQQK